MTRPSTHRPTGRPPTPPEIKLLTGNPGKRKIPPSPIAEKPSSVPPVPSTLGPAGRRAWGHYWTTGRGWVALADLLLIERLCSLHDDAAAVKAKVDEEGMFHQNEDTGRSAIHGLYDRWLGLLTRIDTGEAIEAFNATDRSRLRVDATDTGDAIDQWAKATG